MKRFYKNTLMSRVFKNALRVVALLCVLFGVSSSAWGAYYLHYNTTGSHTKDIGASDLKWTDGVEPIDNVCTWTLTTSSWDNYVYIMSSKTNMTPVNIKEAKITNSSSAVNFGNISEHQGNYLFYFKLNSGGTSTTIRVQYNTSTKVITFSDGTTVCTPSATITGASYNGASINLSGRLTQVCDSKTTYYGWQYKTSANGNWENDAIHGQSNSSTVALDYSLYWNNGGNLVPGTTYYFRAYATYDAKTWYSDDKILSVTIPSSGGGDTDCSNMVYLKPTTAWKEYDAWFAAYFFGTIGDKWVAMTPTESGGDCDGLYYCEIPDGYPNVIFVRKNPTDKNLETFDDNWGKTADLILPDDGINQFTCDDGAGSWSESLCTEGCSSAAVGTNVLLARKADVNKDAKTAKLYGYIKDTDCSEVTDYGFYYCTVVDGSAACKPTESSTKLAVDPSHPLQRGEEFNATLNELVDGQTYYYRAYAVIAGKTQLSGEIRSFSTDPCIPQPCCGDPIIYTVNASPDFKENACKLHFKSLQDAIDHLKRTANYEAGDPFKYVTESDGSYNLNQPVVMRVAYYDDAPDDETKAFMYEGTTEYGITAGNETPDHINLIADFNKNSLTPENTLSIKPLGSKAKPWIHHIVIRNSKNIVLDSLCIYSDITGKGDNALEIDVNSTDWGRLDIDPTISSVAPMLDANITIQNSMIGSVGFTGVHVSCYGGITFKNNDFECTYPGTEDNALRWGASAKFLACKDVKFIQNNFRGSQTSLLWIQESQNMLFMNNVFWNTNTNSTDKDQPIAAVRLVHQFDSNTNDYKKKSKVKNISFFYNTFYLADDKKESSHNYNFYCLSNSYDAHSTKYEFDLSSLYFKYNNCYSYDENLAGRSDNSGAFLGIDLKDNQNFCPNNFWSEYDQNKGKTTSDFAFGCSNNTFTNVKTQVCETTASGPASLIVKGQAMNTGKKLTDSDISSTGIELTANELTSDRYLIGVRPKDDTWTMGAYQSKNNIETKVIYWVGISSDWDDRNNWEYETEVDGKMVRQRVSCVNILSEDLKVVVEEIGTVEVDGGRKWPQVPASFTENRTNSEYDEHVSAGLGTGKTPTKFASTIELEYGAGIRGVENLNDNGTLRYDRAIVHFDIEAKDRKKWLLVGPVVKPFASGDNATTGTTRNVESGDYFKNYEPHMYMHEITPNGDTFSWNKTFGDLNIPVLPNTVFALQASTDYGPYFDTAEDYKYYEGIDVSDSDPVPYTFTGRFIVEENKTDDYYKFNLNDGKNLLNNVYPCNLNAKTIEALEDDLGGTINVYNYSTGAFESTTASAASGNVYIKAQNGFVFIPNDASKPFAFTNAILAEGSTRTRATERVLPTFSLNVDNANTTKPGASNVVIRYDDELGNEVSPQNTPKVFTKNTDTPEAYIINKENKYTRLITGKENVSIPLGIRVLKGMNVTFEKVYNEGYEKVTLVDTKTRKEYNLLARSYTTDVLEAGETEGRFYLNLAYDARDVEDDDDNYEDVEDEEELPTDVDETEESIDINIYAVDGDAIHVITNGTSLQTIYVSDMAGRTDKYDVEGYFAELRLPVAQGVYTVTVVTDKATKIGKVILK